MDAYEKILDLQVPQFLRLSPDATRVVYSTTLHLRHKIGDNGVSSLWIADVGKQNSARQLTSGLFKDRLPQWTPDGASVIFISDRKEAGKKIGLYQLHLSGGEPILLTDPDQEKPIDNFAISPDGKFVAFISADEKSPERKRKDEEKDDVDVFGEDWDLNRLRLLHLTSRTVETLVTGDCHLTDLVWSPDGDSIAYTATPTPELESGFTEWTDLRKVDISTKQVVTISRCEYEPANAFGGNGLHWSGDHIYLVANAIARVFETAHVVYSVSVADGKWKREVGGETYDGVGIHASGGMIVAKVQNDLYDELRTPSGETFFRDLCTVTGFHVMQPGKDTSETVFALIKSTVNRPAEVFTFTSSSREPIVLSSHAGSFTDDVAIALQVHIPSADGDVELDGLFVYPSNKSKADRPSEPLKTLIHPHGGPYSRTTSCFLPVYGWLQPLIRSGYAFFMPNYRGGASHGPHFAGPYEVGTKDYEDIIALTQHIVKQGFADPENLIIGGWSQGGFLSYLSAVRNGTHGHGWKFKGSIAGAGISDWDTMALTSDLPSFQTTLTGGSPWELDQSVTKTRQGSALWEFAAAAKEGRIPPMLLLHGQEDVRVPVTQAWGFQRACRKWGLPCQMVTYPRADHLFAERKQFLDLARRVITFCDMHFK